MRPIEETELVYLLRREAEERARAVQASVGARPLHCRLADGYAAKIVGLMGEPRFERDKQRGK
ncbi:hypothetical protein [Sphingomonas crusticola]|uniref:hypothetical protein n=1 Tax=Sphingomonas crusticola TaxID=1697973 RepID=UPI000E269530|nr:hypothetical protein [Sphingomonas crusticola]